MTPLFGLFLLALGAITLFILLGMLLGYLESKLDHRKDL